MQILIIEDNPGEIGAARSWLASHELIIVGGINGAQDALHNAKEKPFDAILIDNEQGAEIALAAIVSGVKMVGIFCNRCPVFKQDANRKIGDVKIITRKDMTVGAVPGTYRAPRNGMELFLANSYNEWGLMLHLLTEL